MMMNPNYGHLRLDRDVASALRRSPGSTNCPLLSIIIIVVVGVAALRHAHPADRAAVARRGAEGSRRDGRRQPRLLLLLHRPAAPRARHHRRHPDRDDLPARRLRRDPRHDQRRSGLRLDQHPLSSSITQALLELRRRRRVGRRHRRGRARQYRRLLPDAHGRQEPERAEAMARAVTRQTHRTFTILAWIVALPDLLPDPLDDPHQLQDRGRRHPRSRRRSCPSALDAGELRRGAGTLQLLRALRSTRSSSRSARPCSASSSPFPAAWSMAFSPAQAHQGPPDVDAVDQDDAGGRRAGADLPHLQEPRTCSTTSAGIDRDPDADRPADRHLDALHLLQGNPGRHPRGRAHGRRRRCGRRSSTC